MKLDSRKDFETLMFRILDPLKPLYSDGGALLQVGQTGVTYPRRTIQMEGFSRPLWALGPYWLGGGEEPEFAAIYRRGLASGTNPGGPEYWGDPGDCDQLFVEMAAIAAAILEVPGTVWTPLSGEEKSNLARWLDTINHHELPHCNWLFFRVLVNLALDSVGMPCDLEQMNRDLEEVDSWYVGDGWYTDGTPDIKPQRDYYIPWAIQYYGVLYSVFAARRDPARAGRFRERAMAFGREFAFWFDRNGAALPYGRSLTYRFGQCAFYSACVFAGIEPLPLGVMKGIIVRNLEWWCQKPIFDRDGVLTIGYTYPQLYMSERYNAPGSPYWGMKTFLVMALPQDHPFWTVPAAPDSMLAFVIDGYTFIRRHSEEFQLFGDRLVSRWSPFAGITVVTELIPTGMGHIRRHRVESAIACTAYDCGFAVPKFCDGFAASAEGSAAGARNARQRCTVTGRTGAGVLVEAWPNTSLYAVNTVIPAVKYDIPVGAVTLETTVESESRD